MYPPQGNAAGVDVSDADALETDVKAGKTFYSVEAPRKEGTMPTKAIVAGAETYEEGYHAGNPGGLSAIEPDLAPANIKKGVDIFGKVGTAPDTVTVVNSISRYRNVSLSADDVWEVKGTDLVPASAVKIICNNFTANGSSAERDMKVRAIYNGVQKYIHEYSAGPGDCAYDRATFAGLGIEATLTLEHQGSTSGHCCGGMAYYITLT